MDIFSDGTDPKRDVPTKRPMNVSTENDFVISVCNRHGHFKISRERGQVPEQLSGYYTRHKLAQEAVQQYLSQKPIEQKK